MPRQRPHDLDQGPPPFTYTSQLPSRRRVDRDHYALVPNVPNSVRSGIQRCRATDTLSRARVEHRLRILDRSIPPPIGWNIVVGGFLRQLDDVSRARGGVMSRKIWPVGALCVVAPGQPDRRSRRAG
jgi:hypothetical protein